MAPVCYDDATEVAYRGFLFSPRPPICREAKSRARIADMMPGSRVMHDYARKGGGIDGTSGGPSTPAFNFLRRGGAAPAFAATTNQGRRHRPIRNRDR
jgi:hypothetical protein